MRRVRNVCIAALAITALGLGGVAQANVLYWDTNGATAGFGSAGGTWGTSQDWSTDNTGGTLPGTISTTTADDVNFGNGATGLGAGTVTVTGTTQAFKSMTFASGSGAIVLSGGTLQMTPSATTTITVDNAVADTISSILAGSGSSLIKAGTGNLILNFSNAAGFTGATTVNGGTLSLNNSCLYTTTGGLTINNTGTVKVTLTNGLAGGGGGLTVPVTINSGGLMTMNNGLTATVRGTLALNGGTLASGTPNATYGSWFLNGDVTAGGATTSTISATSVNWSGTKTFTVDSNSILNVTGTFANGTSSNFAGNLTKAGTGAMTLSGTDKYTGTTTVNAGLLNVTGTLANNGSGKVFVASAGTVFGSNDPTITRKLGATYTGFGSAISSDLTTTADLTGTATGAPSISMTWRTRDAGELVANVGLISDVMKVAGTGADSPSLTMSYSTAAFTSLYPTGNTAKISLVEITGLDTFVVVPGTVNTALHTVTATLTHAGTYAVIPEPSTIVLLGMSVLGLLAYAWRKRK